MIHTPKTLHDDLELWIRIGIGDDIVDFPHHRPEFASLVSKHKGAAKELIPDLVLLDLKKEIEKPWPLQKTLWRLLGLNLRLVIYNTRKSINGYIEKAFKRI